jgi:hypothetical protein
VCVCVWGGGGGQVSALCSSRAEAVGSTLWHGEVRQDARPTTQVTHQLKGPLLFPLKLRHRGPCMRCMGGRSGRPVQQAAAASPPARRVEALLAGLPPTRDPHHDFLEEGRQGGGRQGRRCTGGRGPVQRVSLGCRGSVPQQPQHAEAGGRRGAGRGRGVALTWRRRRGGLIGQRRRGGLRGWRRRVLHLWRRRVVVGGRGRVVAGGGRGGGGGAVHHRWRRGIRQGRWRGVGERRRGRVGQGWWRGFGRGWRRGFGRGWRGRARRGRRRRVGEQWRGGGWRRRRLLLFRGGRGRLLLSRRGGAW